MPAIGELKPDCRPMRNGDLPALGSRLALKRGTALKVFYLAPARMPMLHGKMENVRKAKSGVTR